MNGAGWLAWRWSPHSPAAPRRRRCATTRPAPAPAAAPTRTSSGTRWSAPSANCDVAAARARPGAERLRAQGACAGRRRLLQGPARLRGRRAASSTRRMAPERRDDGVDRRACCGCATRPSWRSCSATKFGHFRERHSLQQWRKLKRSQRVPGRLRRDRLRRGRPGSRHARPTSPAMRRSSSSAATRNARPTASASRSWSTQGYDPQAGVDLWERHAARGKRAALRQAAAGVRHPPATRERLNDLRAAAAALPSPPRERASRRIPRRHAALPGALARSGTGAASLRQLDPGHQRTARRCARCGSWRAAPSTSAKRIVAAMPPAIAPRPRSCMRERSRMPGVPAEAWREHGFALRTAGRTRRRPHRIAALPERCAAGR